MLSAVNVHKKYKRPVLNGVNLTAGGGEIVGIAGENGSGKSTLLSILTGGVKPDSGAVTIEGEDIFRRPQALKNWVGFVPQEDALFGRLTALDNLKFGAAAYRTDWRNALEFLFPGNDGPGESAAAQYFLRQKAAQLSGGMRKRLSIALALMHRPRCLVMDEPSAGLDIGFKWALADTIRAVKERGGGVILTSHHPDELLLCDRIYVLRGGVFIYEGRPSGLAASGDFNTALYRIIRNGESDGPDLLAGNKETPAGL